jgi:outer membrane protein assembly factor BamB
MRLLATCILFFYSIVIQAQFYNWSMWRFDYGRTASTPEKLAEKLYLQWQVKYSSRIPVWDDPLNQNLMQFDRIFEPIVADGKLFLGFNDQDKVVALDISSGKELWHYYADGPVRLPLAANNCKIYFTSDDGYCYCLNSDNGSLVWKLSLAPASNKLIGNKRLISMWPARGGIVIKGNIIYTSASIFPLMGTFIYAINADTGEIIWKNEGTGSNYILQPHKSPAFAYVAPQGCFSISGDRLLVAGGRTVPAAFDLKTGKELYYQLAASGKVGGAFTCCNDIVFFNHYRERLTYMYDSETGEKLKADVGEYPVVDGNTIYYSGKKITACLLRSKNKLETLWKADFPATNDLIKAGDCLYAADSTGITAIKIVDNKPQKIWTFNTEKHIERLVASNGKLIAVSDDGEILVFGDTPLSSTTVTYDKNSDYGLLGRSSTADAIIKTTGITGGFGVVYGAKDISLIKTLVSTTSLSLIVYDNNPERILYLREYFDRLGIKSDRLSFLTFENSFPLLPKYFSSLTVINDLFYLDDNNEDILYSIFESVRPYDGKIWMKTNGKEQKVISRILANLDLHGAEFKGGKGYSMISRTGPLEGSADWTHNYGNISNTVKSDDEIVKAPLGILWFGGNSNLDVLPRHGHGPSEQVIDGRLFIQGINSISARDVYTGRLLWKKVFDYLKDDTWLVYYDETYDEENPLDTKYNQVHLPGANARGTNFIATKEFIYVIEGNKCHLLDTKTGESIETFTTGETQRFAYIGVYNNYLILGNNFADYKGAVDIEDKKANPKFENYNLSASQELIVLDRFIGKKIWSLRANNGFIHNSVIAGNDILFCLDKLPQILETRLRRRGENIQGGARLLYLNINTGKIIFEETKNIFGSWLGYSDEYKLLLQATRPSRDMLNGEDGKRMIVYNIPTKEILWDKTVTYSNPPIISGDKIYTNGEGFSLFTGESLYEKDLLTGEEIKWSFKREYGCGYVVASEHLLTFRSASAGFINLDVFEGTASLGGFKAGCSANLIVANGVLNSPDYTRTCQCPYQNQTSLAFIYMPWMNYWTNSNYKWSGKQIKKLGLNLNAPGDRTSSDNTLWLEFPNAAGESSGIPVKMDTVGYITIRKDPISVYSENTPWISSSAIGGIRSLEITLSNERDVPQTTYKINLYFSELENKKTGERVFDVIIQNNKVLEDFDIVSQAGKKDKEIIKTFTGITAGKSLKIEMDPKKGNTILSGIELVEESTPIRQIAIK